MEVSEIKYTYKSTPKKNRVKVTGSLKACEVLRNLWDDDINLVETVYVLILNRANEVIGYKMISKGGRSGAFIDVKVIFTAALIQAGTSVILAHNHPSGNTTPSEADKRITKQTKEAGKVLDMPLVDHIILTEGSYFSFVDDNIF